MKLLNRKYLFNCMQVVKEEEDDTLEWKLQVFFLTYFSNVISQRQLENKKVCKVYNGTAASFLFIVSYP